VTSRKATSRRAKADEHRGCAGCGVEVRAVGWVSGLVVSGLVVSGQASETMSRALGSRAPSKRAFR
jgi:hypothetical protein